MYLVHFLSAACSAEASAVRLAAVKYEAAVVAQTVTFYAKGSPPRHGITVQPLGCFPSLRTRPAGSFVTGMLAALKERLIQSLRAWCLTTRLGTCLQTKPCIPLASTILPHLYYSIIKHSHSSTHVGLSTADGSGLQSTQENSIRIIMSIEIMYNSLRAGYRWYILNFKPFGEYDHLTKSTWWMTNAEGDEHEYPVPRNENENDAIYRYARCW